MKCSMSLYLTVAVCVASLLLNSALARPFENQLSDKEREVGKTL